MTQRFGRNQRRRARKAIADLQSKTVNLTQALAEIEGLLRDAVDMAGRMSILFPAKEVVKVNFKSTDRYRVQVLPDNHTDFSRVGFSAATMTQRVNQLETLIARISKDQLTEAIHAHVIFGDGEFSYGITLKAWQSMDERQRTNCIQRELPLLFTNMITQHNFR